MSSDPDKEWLDAFMEGARRFYEGGEKEYLWHAIRLCHGEGVPLPSWAIEALASGAREIMQGRSDNWGDVFGRPTELRGRRDRAYWREVWGDLICTMCCVRIELKMPWLEVWDDVADALRENHETQIRQDGRAPPSASTIRNIYYEMRPFEPVLDDDEQP